MSELQKPEERHKVYSSQNQLKHLQQQQMLQLSQTSGTGSFRWPSHVATQMADFIHEEVKDMLACSRLVRKADGVALVHREDVQICTRMGSSSNDKPGTPSKPQPIILGKGAFSEVTEVIFEKEKYAMKHLKQRLMSQPENFRLAASELAVEAHMLASFDHPNILKIRGWAYNGIASFADGRHDSFFLLLDKLDETLDQRILNWQKSQAKQKRSQGSSGTGNNPVENQPNGNHQSAGGGGMFGNKKNRRNNSQSYTMGGPKIVSDFWKRLSGIGGGSNNGNSNSSSTNIKSQEEQLYEQKAKNLYLERLGIVTDLASALNYLHEKGVIFRDLKPNNIGFLNERIQLFDYGLSRELPSLDTRTPFEMSGKVGTLRYMAIEVAQHKPYNVSADVYSWSMVCYEMMTLQKPFGGWTRDMHASLVCTRGVRPEIPRDIAADLKSLLDSGWSQRPNDRPTMSKVLEKCRKMEQHQMFVCNQIPGAKNAANVKAAIRARNHARTATGPNQTIIKGAQYPPLSAPPGSAAYSHQ